MKILVVSTISNTVNAFLIPHIRMLIEEGHQVDVAFKIEKKVSSELYKLGCKVHNIPFSRSPFNLSNINAYRELQTVLTKEKYDIVHTHTPTASTIVRLACKKNKKINVFYTAHGFHFYKGAPIINWLLYYPIEKWLSRYTDFLITINKEDYKKASENFKATKVEYVPGVGIDINSIKDININKLEKRRSLKIPDHSFVILSIGELNNNKNHEVVIRALSKINNKDFYYLICGEGPLEEHLTKLTNELNLSNQVKLLGYRNDIIEICKASDIFVFPSFREGLPVSVMEAMACGLPVICTNIRGNRDLVQENKGGYLFNINDSTDLANKIEELVNNSSLLKQYSHFNTDYILRFETKKILEQMKTYYITKG